MLTGYLTTLPTDCLLNAGVLFYTKAGNYVPIGVTDGAPDFDPGVELGEIGFDNRAASRLKGLTRRVGFQPVFKGTLKEFGPSASGGQIAVIEADGTEATATGVTTETVKAAGSLYAVGAYLVDFRWIFERAGGGYAAIYAPLAIVRKWSAKGNDKKEASISFEIEAIGDPVNDLSTAPYAIELRTALPGAMPTDGSVADVIAHLGSSSIISIFDATVGVSTSGSNVTQWDDARGVTGARPSLVPTGTPTIAAGIVTMSGASMKTAANAIYDLNANPEMSLAFIGEVDADNNYPIAVADPSGSFARIFSIFGDTGKWSVQEFNGNASATCVGVRDTTPRLVIGQHSYSIYTTPINGGTGFTKAESYGAPPRVDWSGNVNGFAAGNNALCLGLVPGLSNTVVKARLVVAYKGSLTAAMIASLARRAALLGVATDTAHQAKLFLPLGDSNSVGYGTTNTATDSWPTVLGGKADMSTWYVHDLFGFGGALSADGVALMDKYVLPLIEPAVRTKHYATLQFGTNDLYDPVGGSPSAATILANLQTIGTKIRAAGGKVIVFTVPKSSGGDEGTNPKHLAVNTGIRAAVTNGWADYVYDVYPLYDPTTNPIGSGEHWSTAQNASIATDIDTIVGTLGR